LPPVKDKGRVKVATFVFNRRQKLNMRVKGFLANLLLGYFSLASAGVYIVPSDIDIYKQRTDTVVDLLFNKICSNQESSLQCDISQVPAYIYTNLELSKVNDLDIKGVIKLQGIDKITFCDDYTARINCKEFQIDDHTSFRFEIIPFNQIDTYEIRPPNCMGDSFPVAVPLTFTQCPIGVGANKAFIQASSGGNWKLNINCYPVGMNLPILTFCNTYSK